MSKHNKQESDKRIDDETSDGAGPRDKDGQPGEAVFGEALETPAESAEIEALSAALAASEARATALGAEVSSLKDQYLRKLADYENFRKRMFREKDDAVTYANTQILTDLVGVIDNFDRAVQSSETSKDFQSLHDGVDMIRKSLLGLLESKYGLARFESLGVAFDPNVHEAVMSDKGDCEEPMVVEEFVKGYKLRDRVLRTAKVKVRMPEPRDEAARSEETMREEKA